MRAGVLLLGLGVGVAGNHHGDGKLWLVLPARGELVAVPPGAAARAMPS